MVELRVINTAERSVAQTLAAVKQSLGTKPWNPVFSVCNLFSFLLQRVVPRLAGFYGFGFLLAGSGFVIFFVASFMLRSIMLRSIVAIANIGGGLEFLKRFDRADDGAVLVVNGNGVNADGNFRSGVGMQETDGPRRVAMFSWHGRRDNPRYRSRSRADRNAAGFPRHSHGQSLRDAAGH
jgi:hypothetical protein